MKIKWKKTKSKIKTWLDLIKTWLYTNICDLIVVLGLIFIAAGAFMVYVPLGFITTGLLLIRLAIYLKIGK